MGDDALGLRGPDEDGGFACGEEVGAVGGEGEGGDGADCVLVFEAAWDAAPVGAGDGDNV